MGESRSNKVNVFDKGFPWCLKTFTVHRNPEQKQSYVLVHSPLHSRYSPNGIFMVSWRLLSLQKPSVLLQLKPQTITGDRGICIHSSLLYVTWDNTVRDIKVKRIQSTLHSLPATSVCALQNTVACNILRTASMASWVCVHDCLERGREHQVSCTLFTYKKWKTTVSFQGLWLTFHGWIVRYVGTKKHPFSLAYKCSNG